MTARKPRSGSVSGGDPLRRPPGDGPLVRSTARVERIKSGAFRDYYDQMYGTR
jgi:hypothetical protein